MGYIKNIITLVGLYKISHPIYSYSIHYYNNKIKEDVDQITNQQRLQTLYNPKGDKWAIVTGASEGIGRSYALDLSKSGFNILLASRSTEKL